MRGLRKSWAIVGAIFSALTMHSANASGAIACLGIDTPAEVSIVLGAGPIPSFLSVSVTVGGQTLTTLSGQPGVEVALAQAYDDGEFVRVDLADLQATEQVASVRIIRADDKSGPLLVGYAHIHGSAPAAILCEGP